VQTCDALSMMMIACSQRSEIKFASKRMNDEHDG